ncbi:MAG TPA: ABC transporter substrate-binding protein, partial [Polyangia bacterium]
ALKLAGLTDKDVTFVDIVREGKSSQSGRRGWAGERPEISLEAQALLRGEVDAIFHKGSRGLEVAEAIGAVTVFDLGKHPDPNVRVNNGSPRTLTVDAGLIERDLGLVVRLVKRVLQAGQWADQHPREAAEYVASETGSSVAAVWKAYGDVHQHLRTDLEESSIAALGDFKDFLFQWGFLPNDFDVRAWIDPRPLKLALEELAAERAAPSTSVTKPRSAPAAELR